MTESFVLDVSATVPWALPDQASDSSDAAREALAAGATAQAPPLWKYELASVLLMAERRGTLADGDAEGFMPVRLVGRWWIRLLKSCSMLWPFATSTDETRVA